ncbi:60S ribosomal protein L35a-3 [Astathelohania contejeani]|uniref:60S ribosomal protein L35a-3 n=1 Tax=Astathelohania contejeani TaxID=164912 RepID=A0ABQ7HV43_9MICR|nr:60S ribosomal protein L35a-3 [Thelohania contejeani]
MIELMERHDRLIKTSVLGTFVSHRRGKSTVHPNRSLIKIDNVTTREQAQKYVLNSIVAIRSTKTEQPDGSYEIKNYGVITKVHGKSGLVQAKFSRNLPPKDFGKRVFIQLYKVDREEFK